MGKQVDFFMDGQDEREFAEFVTKIANVVFVPQVSHSSSLPEFRRLEEANRLKDPIPLQLWNKAILARPTVEQYAPNIFAANVANNDPIIAFRRSFFHGSILVAGELSAEMYSLDAVRKQLVYKGRDFERWYDSLARWIRRHYTREKKYGIYIGSSASQTVEHGGIQLAQHLMPHGPI